MICRFFTILLNFLFYSQAYYSLCLLFFLDFIVYFLFQTLIMLKRFLKLLR